MMIPTYTEANQLSVIDDKVDGVGPWLWMKSDDSAYEIIKHEWDTHKEKWFKKLKGHKVVLQAGGCCGMYPRLLAERFRTVYTFEPDPMAFTCLSVNCQFDSVFKINAALGNKRGLVGWMRISNNIGMSKIDNEQQPLIPQMRIDDLELPELDLLALDMEGNEPQAIEGALNTIARCLPVVVVENGKRVEHLMKYLGYKADDESELDTIFIPELE